MVGQKGTYIFRQLPLLPIIQSTSTPSTNSQEGTITYEYNSFGEPISIADNDETKEITYSNFGEVIKEVTGLQTNSYQYDEDGNLIKHIITDKDLEDYVTEYSYTKSGLVSSIKTGMGTETIAYDKAGRIKEKANEHTGFSKSYIYYPDNNIREIKTRMDGKLVYYENFAYDKNGNKIYDDQNGDIRKYTYDGLNRLTGAEIGNVRTEYEFDNYNNISREYEIIGAKIEKKSYYYDNANRLLLEDGQGTVQYEYDNSGNLIKKITGIGSNAETAHYRYDGYNRLSEFIDNYSTAEYSYNINGLRESKTVNGTKTRYIYNQENIIGEIFDDNIYTYYRATELIGYKSNKGDRYYYRQNSHGDVTALLTVDGQEKKTYSYNAYGKENPFILNPMGNQTAILQWRAETEQIYNPFRYVGEYYDSETGLIYLRNRYYDNSTGRFITEDPIKDGLNWYVYCGNNPVMFVDPMGLDLISIEAEGTVILEEHKFTNVFIQASSMPIFNQLDSEYGDCLCWATCASMLISGRIDDYQEQHGEMHTLTEQEIIRQIINDNPFAMLYGQYARDEKGNTIFINGRWCLVVGYIESFEEEGPETQYIRFDPWGGEIDFLTYDELNRYGDLYWAETAY